MVMHSTEQMFELVNDVARYQEFLPWCGRSEVLEETGRIMLASVEISFKGVHKSFITRNTMTPYESTELVLVDGPFSELGGMWRFKSLSDDASKISLDLDFGFSNALVATVVGPVFRLIADSMVDAFCKRGDQIY